MVRTQIQLTEELYRKLKKWSRDRRISLSEAIRRCVSEKLSREQTTVTREEMIREALAVCGKYDDPKGATTVARDHDRYLGEAFGR
jgi:metal-responsive CopG/Arc/MetJ family transcriptional regulator